ncbi:MAG: hypothetical protein CL601_00635 [Alteromonas sp.]|jgi:hypothetical protein|nr:hypothetical protein [Alteromonas sp.]MBC6983959.1 hypothetical protein [Alteromonas sp. BZK5]NKX20366.1 hypothetical protein [Alteromonadaceae bacterium A_SAG2]|tara:strand:+ start:53 stop:430 length:378 start_codon:yes stop_codon:yes gene_type:complete
MLLNLHYAYQSKHSIPLINSKLNTKSYTGDIIMPTDAQLLIGKVLQIKDKIIAKRHCIPSDLKAEWNTLNEQTACFETEALYRSAVKGQEMNKHIDYSGSVKELSQLVKQLKTLNKKVNVTRVHH